MDRIQRGAIAAATALLTAVPALAVAQAAPMTQAAHPRPSFVSRACPADVFPPDRDVDCGYIVVPEDRSKPDSRQITVAAAVVHATAPKPAPDPIVFVEGGPSVGALRSFPLDYYFAGADFAADHDLVLVDTRGTGLSTPRLGCPEFDRASVRAFYSGSSLNSRALPIYTTATRHCRNRLEASGIDLAAYNSAESAADLDALRRALRVDSWNVLAVSADGVLGLTYLRMFPGHIRSVILDSAASTNMVWGLDYDRGLTQELEAIFAGCRANDACRTTYPGIRQRFYAMVDQMNAHPRVITLPRFRPHPVRLVLDGVGLYYDVLTQIFPGDRDFPENIHPLLDMMWAETHGQLVSVYRGLLGTGPVTNDHTDDVVAQGKSMSYLCHDQIGFITPADLRRAARDIPALAPRYLSPDYDLADGFSSPFSPAGCRVWQVGVAGPQQFEPVASAVPTLVLAGEYDTGIPPYVVRQITEKLSHSLYVEFPASAHLQLASYNAGSDCARAITSEFLDRPSRLPDTSCVADLPAFDFTPPTSKS
ncbi:MAG: alpha/beta fold hydrolase [Actinomycetales bacterium]